MDEGLVAEARTPAEPPPTLTAIASLYAVRSALPHKAELRFHDLRHTCASLLIAAGAHPKAIQERLGHSSIQITMDRYGHLLPSADAALAAALDATHAAAATPPPPPIPLRVA